MESVKLSYLIGLQLFYYCCCYPFISQQLIGDDNV